MREILSNSLSIRIIAFYIPYSYQIPETHKEPKALVIGCGLGDDAEALAARGFQVTAFDISPTAIAWSHQRFPDSLVNYLVADLFSLDRAWDKAFDLVIESRTIQSLPLSIRTEVIKAIVRLVAPHGILLVITHVSHSEKLPDGPPWPVSEAELSQLKDLGCHENERVTFEIGGIQQLCLEYSNPG